jgi:hypothetical protein
MSPHMSPHTCSTPGCWKTVYGPGDQCGHCLQGRPPADRGPVKNSTLMRARLLPGLDQGVTRSRLIQHGQLRAVAADVPVAVKQRLHQGGRPQMPAPRPVSVFLSYASEQRAKVLQIDQHLRAHGHPTWLDVHQLDSLKHLDDTIFGALQGSQYFVACLSAACKDNSRYVYRELAAALQRAPANTYLYLLPVVMDGTAPAAEMAACSPLDFADPQALDQIALTLEISAREVI